MIVGLVVVMGAAAIALGHIIFWVLERVIRILAYASVRLEQWWRTRHRR